MPGDPEEWSPAEEEGGVSAWILSNLPQYGYSFAIWTFARATCRKRKRPIYAAQQQGSVLAATKANCIPLGKLL
jgi:hypothetical protein